MNTIQSPHSSTQQRCLCLMCHTEWMPQANIFLQTGCLSPNYRRNTFSWGNKRWRILASFNCVKCCCFSAFFVFLCVAVEFGTLGAEDTAGCSKLRTENSQAEARDKVLWIANKQGFSGEWLGMNPCREWWRIVPRHSVTLKHDHVKEQKRFIIVKNKWHTNVLP